MERNREFVTLCVCVFGGIGQYVQTPIHHFQYLLGLLFYFDNKNLHDQFYRYKLHIILNMFKI